MPDFRYLTNPLHVEEMREFMETAPVVKQFQDDINKMEESDLTIEQLIEIKGE